MQRNWTIRLVTFVLWLLAAGSVTFWALKWVSGNSAPAYASAISAAVGMTAGAGGDGFAVAKALGGGFVAVNSAAATQPVVPSTLVASRFVLTGVVDGSSSGRTDMALIAIDGKPARPYRLGAALEAGVVLQSVQERKAVIGPQDGTSGLALELPARAAITGITTQPVTSLAPVSGTLLSRNVPAPAPMAVPPGAAVAPLTPIGIPPAPVVIPPNPSGASVIDPAQAAATAANVQALERMGANRKQRAAEATAPAEAR